MEEYYYLKGREQKGPFTIDQLKYEDINAETLVWTEGMSSWQKLGELPYLNEQLNPKTTPPPPPDDEAEVTTRSKNTMLFLIGWIAFHLFALLMSTSRVSGFNNGGNPKSSEFWPFVKIYETVSYPVGGHLPIIKNEFNGIFADYDWTEFSFYAGAAILIYIISRVLK